MVTFSDEAQASAASKPLGKTRLVVENNEFFIAVDEGIRNKIVAEILKEARYDLADPGMIEHQGEESLNTGGKRNFARDIYPQLAIVPAYLGLMAAIVVEHFFPLAKVNDSVSKAAEFVPVVIACAAALGNLMVLYLRKDSTDTAQE